MDDISKRILNKIIRELSEMPRDGGSLIFGENEKEISDRRVFPRKPYFTPVDYTTSDHLYQEYIFDISAGGAYIETRQPLPVGKQIALTFSLPTSRDTIRLNGTVVRNDPKGIGVAFLSPDKETRQAIISTVTGL